MLISIDKKKKMHRRIRKWNIKDSNEIVKDLHRLTCLLQINLDKYDKEQMNINHWACLLFFPTQKQLIATVLTNRSSLFKK